MSNAAKRQPSLTRVILLGFWRRLWGEPGDFSAAARGRYSEHRAQQKAAEAERQRLEGLFFQAALRAFDQVNKETQAGPNMVQYEDADVRVDVKSGYSRDRDQFTTDIKVYDRDPSVTTHLHIIFDESGHEFYRSWNPDRPKRK